MGLLFGAKVDQALASSRGLVLKAHYGDHFSGTIHFDQSLEQNVSVICYLDITSEKRSVDSIVKFIWIKAWNKIYPLTLTDERDGDGVDFPKTVFSK